MILGSNFSIYAQQSRAEEWQKKREEKSKQTQPASLGRLEEGLLWLEKRGLREIINFHYKNLYPKLGTLSTGSGFAAGVRYWQPNVERTFVDVQTSAVWSIRGYQHYDLQFGEVHRVARGPFVFGDLKYRYYPQEDFFGLGPASARQNRTSFLQEQADFAGVAGFNWNRWLSVAGRAGWTRINIGPGTDRRFPAIAERFDDSTAPGLARQPNFWHVGGSLQLDYRDDALNPHRGGVAMVALERYDDSDSSEFEFNRFVLDARHYLPLGNETRVLALRAYTSLDEPSRHSRVPFYLQQTLGGGNMLRGFREFRYRGEKILYLSAEYRWEAAPFWEFALFVDEGKVFSRDGDFNLRQLQKDWGVGTRFKTKRGVFFRLDVARSRDGTRVFMKFEPSF